MLRTSRLVIGSGVLGLLFFWVTDPTWGLGHALMQLVGANENLSVLDARRQAMPGTIVGLVGSCAVLVLGLTLLARRRS